MEYWRNNKADIEKMRATLDDALKSSLIAPCAKLMRARAHKSMLEPRDILLEDGSIIVGDGYLQGCVQIVLPSDNLLIRSYRHISRTRLREVGKDEFGKPIYKTGYEVAAEKWYVG